MTTILSVSGIGPHLVSTLTKRGISTAEQLAATSSAALIDIPGIGILRAEKLLAAARLALEGPPPTPSKVQKTPVRSQVREAPQKSLSVVKLDTIVNKSEIPTAQKKASSEDDKKKAAKKVKNKETAMAKKEAKKKKSKQKVAAKKASKKKASANRIAKKEAKTSKSKKSGKSKKK